MRSGRLLRVGLVVVLLLLAGAAAREAVAPSQEEQRAAAQKQMNDGNFRDAYDVFRKLALDPDTEPLQVRNDLVRAVNCLRRLGRIHEVDALIEGTVEAHAKNWRLLHVAAQQYMNVDHYGFMIAGEFRRGRHRGGGKMVSSLDRDRVRAMQLMVQATPLADQDDQKAHVADFYWSFASAMLYNRGYSEAWRLQYATDLTELPDYEEGYPHWRNWSGAPVDENGEPVFYTVPKSWDDAVNDGQRWRWLLTQTVENAPSRLNEVRWHFGNFLHQQFGVHTMQHFQGVSRFFGLPTTGDDDTRKDESGTYELHTLEETETIARLATGIKRLELPDEFNFVRIFQQIADNPDGGFGENALNQLAQIFENRRQYPAAAKIWQRSITKYGPGNNHWKQQRLNQIVKNWGAFEGQMTKPAGKGATLEFRYRNGRKVSLTAHAIHVDKLLADVKAYLKGNPQQVQWENVNLHDVGWRLVDKNQKQYLGEQVAAWDLELNPRENHFDRRITITTPLQKGGAYLLTAKMDGGNTSKIVVWLADLALAHKTLPEKQLYYVADAVTGKPVAGANVEFFGWRQERVKNTRQYNVITANFAEKTNADGLVMTDPRDQANNLQWLVVARQGESLAFLGFQGVWHGRYHDAEYKTTKVFCITDRPVYRPEQKVHFKFWVRHAQYDKQDESQFAGRTFPVEIFDPRGEKILTQSFKADTYGGFEGELELADDAVLGQYRVHLDYRENGRRVVSGGNTFRVEEYKKPEFEVTVEAPDEPVMLGEKITAKIQAKYYFGSPVTKARVKYKITRSAHSESWYPVAPWDWFYGPGYWWYCYDYHWYPGYTKWVGCRRPTPWWWHRAHTPPELVADREVEIGEDGTVEVEIDTEMAKLMHGDQDHSYTITAEVRDESRRTIVGRGNVLVARKPFKVFTWVDRGYFRVGDVIGANFSAQTLDHKPVQGRGVATLLKITYDRDLKPVETPVRRWKLDTNDEGRAELQMKASAKGQYRLSYQVTDSAEHKIEGGYLFTIIGEGFDGADYRFNHVELIPDKREYKPGEKVRLQVNTDRVGSTVLLFVRPANSVYLPPKVLRLTGKSTVTEIDVTKKDMPNFFVEAMTIADGRAYSEAKEIVVPPEKRVLDVAVEPSAKEYLPGAKATVKVKLTDHDGEPFVGSTVVTIYDKAVEYISGGSNVPDIREFFWKWRRRHNPRGENSLARYQQNRTPSDSITMAFLGVFGASVADEMDAMEGFDDEATTAKPQSAVATNGIAFGAGGMRKSMARGAMLADAAPMEMAAEAAPGAPATPVIAPENGSSGGQAAQVEPTVRTNFADTALWAGTLTTDANGTAEVTLDMPENLTGWKIKVWGMGHGTKVGAGDEEVVTRKNLILRLQAPRFFVQKDEVVLSANVHNYLDVDKEVEVVLELPGEQLESIAPLTQKVKIPAGGEQRVDWRVKVIDEGTAAVRMKALTDVESDAMEMKFPCYVHGMLKTESWAGTVRPEEDSAAVTINVPAERRINQSRLEVRYSPTLAGAMVDALPYLAEYPYGCTEQTLNRFVPSVITQKVLLDMQLDLEAIGKKRTNLNAQEIGDDLQRAKQWKRFDRNPVFEPAELDRMVKEGVKRLTMMQNGDGGWGWFSGYGERSYPHTTAVVMHGLQVAQQNDMALVPGVLERGIAWLERYQDEQVFRLRNFEDKNSQRGKPHADNIDAFVFMVLVDADKTNADMLRYLYRDRIRLSVYAKAMFGLALHTLDDQEKLDMILANIEQFLMHDEENETAYLELPEGQWWYWYGSEVEANAYYLKLLARTDPKGKAAPRLVKYLLNNRKHSTYWNSTRDTALCVEAFADYLAASGEMRPDMTVEIWVDGQKRQEARITADNLFTFDNKFVLTGDAVEQGEHKVEIRRTGQGPVYFNAYLTNFTLEDVITAAGLEIKVQRKYYKLVPVDKTIKAQGARGQAVDQRVEKYERRPLANLDTLTSGDLVEIELEIDSKNDYEYLMFEDMKAAGFEPVELRSGYSRNGLGAYMELRDERVTFFVRWLARGKHSIAYRMRAEIPGRFSALPTRASAMYAPELRANSDEIKLQIED